MKITLTALSLMLVLGSVSSVQAATFTATHGTATHTVATSHDTVARPGIEGDFAATHTVNTHMGTFGVNKDSVLDKHPDSAAMGCSMTRPGTC